MHPLDGVYAKLDRARHHLDELNTRLTQTFDLGQARFVPEMETPNRLVYRVHGVPDHDPTWSVLAGEALFQCRSSLDHLAWQLVLADGKQPGRRTQFPILDAAPSSGIDLDPSLSRPMREAIDAVQPYHGDANRIRLRSLRDLNNIDKHRLLLLMITVFDYRRSVWAIGEGDPMPRVSVRLAPVSDGDKVIWFDFGHDQPPEYFDPSPLQLTVKFSELDQESEIQTHYIMNALELIYMQTRYHTVDRFREFF